MKFMFYLLSLLVVFGIQTTSKAQSFSCADFSIVGMAPDSLDSTVYNVSIEFSAQANTFVNYPYVSAVLDCNGDTVATGGMFFFGQFGQTTSDYPVTLNGSLLCEPLSAVFVYLNDASVNDTCSLSFGSNVGVINQEDLNNKFTIFPNPTSSQVNIQCDLSQIGSKYTLHDFTGKQLSDGKLTETSTLVDISGFPQGLYFFRVGDQVVNSFKLVKE
jgi:hypothetical protein